MAYSLEKYRGMATRHECPQCQDKRSLARYVDEHGNYLASNVGRCNHESGCGYHYTPKDYFRDHPDQRDAQQPTKPIIKTPKPEPQPDYFDREIMQRTFGHENNFAKILYSLMPKTDADRLLTLYNVGSSKAYDGGTVFWQVDQLGRIRTGKIMPYNVETRKRDKDVYPPIKWAHKELKMYEFNLRQCLFGLHLINGNNKPIGIVESEKTAIIAAYFMPDFVWLACGGLKNLTSEKCEPLAGRKVILFPDLDAQTQWEEKGRELGFPVSRFLFDRSTNEERGNKWDLADYLIREAEKAPQPEPAQNLEPVDRLIMAIDQQKATPVMTSEKYYNTMGELFTHIDKHHPRLAKRLAHQDIAISW